MAKNIFAKQKEYVSKPKRNVFDLSFQNNLTMQMGYLYPVFCKEVVPGDSFNIKPWFGLRFMPLAFPIQTRMQANLHFFYVRNRNLWKDWPDFIGRTKDGLVSPYISVNNMKEIKTRSLYDYMGLPTTLIGDYGNVSSFRIDASVNQLMYGNANSWPSTGWYNWAFSNAIWNAETFLGAGDSMIGDTNDFTPVSSCHPGIITGLGSSGDDDPITGPFSGVVNLTLVRGNYAFNGEQIQDDQRDLVRLMFYVLKDNVHKCLAYIDVPRACVSIGAIASDKTQPCKIDIRDQDIYSAKWYDPEFDNWKVISATGSVPMKGREVLKKINPLLNISGKYHWHLGIFQVYTSYPSTTPGQVITYNDQSLLFGKGGSASNGGLANVRTANSLTVQKVNSSYMEISDIEDLRLNMYNYVEGGVRISALPFRAYESIYNAFYRNQQNDPFMIDGVPEYNKYLPTVEGGMDTTPYQLYRRNWELDFLTSAVQSPQQGIAPLVGVTASGEFTFQNEDGSTFTAQATVGDDGDHITGLKIQSPADAKTPDGAVQTGTLRAFNEMILSPNGISISDFRNVNALQRWLEVNMRRGFRYKDQLMSHYGVDAKYEELDMPEFIGGLSRPVSINLVNQTTPTEGSPLGSYAGQASLLAQPNHSINHYCDEHGFIIGILSVSPVPNYSQLLPKMFLKHDTLDYFFPEFGHIGMQPITYAEAFPAQALAGSDMAQRQNALSEVFGYQRAWYDYLASTDEVHGLFRTELRNFLINRQFDDKPELGEKFLKIDPDDVNDVFSVTDATDKILGEVYFECTAKRPIPRFGIPRLE